MSDLTFIRQFWLLCALTIFAPAFVSSSASSQTTGYAVGEPSTNTTSAPAKQATAPSDSQTTGPVRMARFSFIQGEVNWRADESLPFSAASTNQPIRQGAQIAVGGGGRAEIQLDDGGYLRVGNGAIITLQLLFSDTEGEFTQIKMTNGLCSLRLKHNRSVYQVDTPLVSVKADGPVRIRIGISDGVEVGLHEGAAVVEGAKGKVTMHAGDYLDLRNETSPFDLHDLPPADSWEKWNNDRDQMLDDAEQSLETRQVPPDIAMVAGNLDAYGTWQTDAAYGQVWCPRTINASWRPYFAGHWVWLNPFGWTWCSDEPWGWAPYHYGTWFHAIYGWAWRPGPANQFWCPAVVHFTESNGNIAWCALSPGEVQYPAAISVGVFGTNWPNYFSVGAAGCYYPAGSGYSIGVAFGNVYSNRSAIAAQGTFRVAPNENAFSTARPFVPVNAKAAAGVTEATNVAFLGRGPFTPLIAGSTALFTRGRTVAAPPVGRAPMFGPLSVRPTGPSLTSSRDYVTSNVDVSGLAAQRVFHSTIPHEPVKTGIAVVVNKSLAGNGFAGAGNAGAVTGGSTGHTTGSAAENAAAARATLNGGRGSNGSGGSGTTGGYTGGRSTSSGSTTGSSSGGVVPGGTTGGGAPQVHPSTGGSPATGTNSRAGSNSAGHTTGGSTPSGGYHVGSGTPTGGQSSGGSPVRR